MTHDERMAAIRARLDALPNFMGLPKSQGAGGWLMSPDGNPTYVDSNTEAFHQYTAHAYGDLTYLMARIERYETALREIRDAVAIRTGTGVVGYDVSYATSVVYYAINPTAVAREALADDETTDGGV